MPGFRRLPPPQVRPSLSRTRLLEQLGRVGDTRLGLVIAPVGSGKTTLIGQWLATQDGPSLRYRADRLPSRSALRSDLSGVTPGAVVIEVGRQAGSVDRFALQRVVEQAMPDAPVVVCARRLPPLNFARGELPVPTVVTEHDLAFRPWEVQALYADILDDPLSGDEVLELTQRTQGWAAAVHLWHVARRLSPQPAVSTAASATSVVPATSRLPECLRTYICDQVLDTVDPQLLAFLRDTSVFDTVTVELADELLGASGSHRHLAEATATVDLVTYLPDESGYRYHRILRDHLRLALAEERGPAGALGQYERAARVLSEHQHWDAALVGYCRAGRWEAASEVVREHGAQLALSRDESADALPETVLHRHPWLAVERARGLLAEGRADQAGSLAVLARDTMREPADQAVCQHVVDQVRRLRGSLRDAHDPWPILSAADSRIGAELSAGQRQAWELARRSLLHLAAGRVSDARTVLADAAGDFASDEALVLVLARFALTTFWALVNPAVPSAALETAYEGLPQGASPWVRRVAYAVVLAKGGNAPGLQAAHQHAAERRRLGDAWGAALIDAAVAVVKARAGRPDAALLEELAGQFRRLGAPALEAWALAALSLVSPAGEDGPESEGTSPTIAVAFARAAQAPGALALAYAAMARTAPDGSGVTDDLQALAETESRACGLGTEPWAWLPLGPMLPHPCSSPTYARADGPARPAVPWAQLKVRCLGGFEVSIDGSPVDLTGVRPIAQTVLRLLAVNAGVPIHREVLVDALWGELRDAAGRHNLQVAVSSLRQRFEQLLAGQGRALFARQGHAYVFAPGAEPVTDLQRLTGMLSQANQCRHAGDRLGQIDALGRAVDLYAGEVLPADGPAEWVVGIRERTRLGVAEAAVRLAQLQLERGQLAPAAEAASRSVQIDPWRDGCWRLLIEIHTRAGDQVKAQRVTQEYHAMLQSLGVTSAPLPPLRRVSAASAPSAASGARRLARPM